MSKKAKLLTEKPAKEQFKYVAAMLEEVQGSVKVIAENLQSSREELHAKIDHVASTLGEDNRLTQAALRSVAGDVRSLQGEMTTVKGDIQGLKEDMIIVKGDVKSLRQDMKRVENKVDQVVDKTIKHDEEIAQIHFSLEKG